MNGKQWKDGRHMTCFTTWDMGEGWFAGSQSFFLMGRRNDGGINSRLPIMGLFDFFKPKRTALPPQVELLFKQMTLLAFPGGLAQIEEETTRLHDLLKGKLSRSETKSLLTRTKAMFVVAEDKTEAHIVPSIMRFSERKLTTEEAAQVYKSLTGVSGELYSGGDGSSPEQAVKIHATTSSVGISAEYAWIEKTYGPREKAWTDELRYHGTADDGRSFETFVIQLQDGSKRNVVFDISAFYGRF